MLALRRWCLVSTVAIAACATTTSTPSSFYKTQADADAALVAYGNANRPCQLWTNWQKMCSRTGPKGAALCLVDPEVNVAPSAVFCSKDEDYGKQLQDARLTAEQISRDRFCTSFENSSPLSKRLGRPLCVDLDRNRPFSGKRLSSRLHPWCGEWKEKNSLKVVTDVKSTSTWGFYCSKRNVPAHCKIADGFGEAPVNSPDHPKYGSGEILVLGIIDEAMNSRVVGVICREPQS